MKTKAIPTIAVFPEEQLTLDQKIESGCMNTVEV